MQGRNNLTRIPQAFTLDPDIINRAYGEEASLVRDILVFVANKAIANFFSDVSFSLDEFCDAFNYNVNSMYRTLPKFIDCPKKELPIDDGHCFDGAFEYALYKGFRISLVFNNKRFNGQFDKTNMLLFSRIQAVYKTTGRREKRYYKIELDYRIKQWMLDGFFLIDQSLYSNIKIPRSLQFTGGLRSFYLYLGRVVSQIKQKKMNGEAPHFVLSVDEAALIMDISMKRNDNRKQRVKKYLDKLIKFLGEKHFRYEFFKGDYQRYEYSIKLFVSDDTIQHYDDKLNTVFFNKLSKGVEIQYFKNFTDKQMLEFSKWSKNLSIIEKREITKWLFDQNSKTFSHVKKYFIEVFENVFEVEYDGRFGEIK